MKGIVVVTALLQCAFNVHAITDSSFSCPADSGSRITNDNGARYTFTCGSDLGGNVFEGQQAVTSFKDCFDFCDAGKPNGTGWAYSRAMNGAGPGYCYLKKGSLYLSGGSNKTVAAIRKEATTSQPSTSRPTTSSRSSTSSALIPSSTPTYVNNKGKRRLAYNNDTLTLPYSQAGQNSQVFWGYDYYYSRYSTKQDTVENPAITFIPLLFNDDSSLTSIWHDAAQSASDAGADALFSFNEPDFCYGGSACMGIKQSVAAYKSCIQLFAGKSKLGAPAATNAGPPYGLTYLGWFIGNCTGCQIDFINLHWYANSYAFEYLQSYVQQAHTMFPAYPIYLAEIGLDCGSSPDTEDRKEAFMKNVTSWLDAVPYVECWAWLLDAEGNSINDNGTNLNKSARRSLQQLHSFLPGLAEH